MILVDTNILVYAEDPHEPAKRGRAIEILNELVIAELAVVSTQVIGEFINTMGRLFHDRYPRPVLANHARILSAALPVLPVDAAVSDAAVDIFGRRHLHYWDAQLWATAKVHGVDAILTEDCPADEIEGVRYVNPFAVDFSGV